MNALLFDAFCLIKDVNAVDCGDTARTLACDDYAVYESLRGDKDNIYAPLCARAIENGDERLYIPSLDLPDNKIDELIDYTLSNPKVRLLVKCAQDLTETGIIDGRFGKSPLMLLHEFGLSERSTVVSGVYLDKDDLSLMAQEGVPLVLLPSFDAGRGFGVAPLCAALERGVKVKIGTYDGSYNPVRSVVFEAKFLRLAVSAVMNRKDAVSLKNLAEICAYDSGQVDRITEMIENI